MVEIAGEIQKNSEQRCCRIEMEKVDCCSQFSQINRHIMARGRAGESVGIHLRGQESLKEVKRQEGAQKCAYIDFGGLSVLKSFRIVTPDILQSDFMTKMIWIISLSVSMKKLTITTAC